MSNAMITSAWWAYADGDVPAIRVEFVLDGICREDTLPFTMSGADRWRPFLAAIGVTLRDVRNKTFVRDDDSIESICSSRPGAGTVHSVTVSDRSIRWNGPG